MMTVKVAVAQMDPKLGQNAANLARILALFHEATAEGARLVVFPECAVSGYGFATLEAGYAAAETIPGPATEALVCGMPRNRRVRRGGIAGTRRR